MKKTFLTLTALLLTTQIATAKDLVIAGQDYPPFNWEENKEVTGGMTDVLKEVCKDLKHNCKFQILNLARGLKMLEDGEIDIFMSLIPNSDRAVYSNFSPTIIVTDMVYMANKKNNIAPFKDVNDLGGFTASAVRASSSLKILQKHAETVKNVTIKEETDNNTLVQRVNNNFWGTKAVGIGSEDVLQYFAAKQPENNLQTVFKIEEQNFVAAYSKKKISGADLDAINKSVEKLKKDGTVKKLLAKYKLRTN